MKAAIAAFFYLYNYVFLPKKLSTKVLAFKFDNFNIRGKSDFSRLGTLYIVALSTIATIIIVGQLLIQNFLKDQFYDSRVINVAGRQRMLSQRISKISLQLEKPDSKKTREQLVEEFEETVYLWKTSQEGLLYGNDTLNLPGKNSKVIRSMFQENANYYNRMIGSCQNLLKILKDDPNAGLSEISPHIDIILENEGSFLTTMDAIVFRYDLEASQKVKKLRITEYILLVISLCVILYEIFYIFKPTAQSVNRTLNKLIISEKNAQKMTKEIGVLYSSLEKSYEKLSSVNQPLENPKLLAKTDRGGNLKFISDFYFDITQLKKKEIGKTFIDLFAGIENSEDVMDELIDTVSEGSSWRKEIKFKGGDQHDIWMDITVTPVFNNQHEITEMMVVGSDLTRRKHAEIQMHQKDRVEIDKKIKDQKFRSVLILEGQEEERKRIAMDIHDGIGQLLTSLKFQIESIDMGNYMESRNKLEDAKNLLKDVIKEVRRVTFNLKPTVLSDYGISAGLAVYVKEINKLTNKEITFTNKTDFSERLPSKIENNIYRIIQEAINNSLKYSHSDTITVELEHSDENLMICIKDTGIGFDEKLLEKPNFMAESGNGFFNMFERTEYINGKLEVSSLPGKGTTVTLVVPLNEYA